MQLSDTQKRILTAGAKEQTADIRSFMQDLKSPAIRDKVLQSMLKNGLVAEQPLNGAHPEKGEKLYTITEAGITAVGGTPVAKPKRASKQDAIITLLEREEGATVVELMEATGWKSHSVRGHLSNMRRKGKANVEAATRSSGERCYRIYG